MMRMRTTSWLVMAVVTLAVVWADRVPARATTPEQAPVLDRFLALDPSVPTQYRALRHFDAKNDRFNSVAWMDVWTETDERGFRYEIADEGGSDYIRSRVFRGTLETEQRSWDSHAPASAEIAMSNYSFNDVSVQADGLVRVTVKPRRKDLLLVDGWIFLKPQDADLVRIEGRLSKSPSFWTRGVHIVRHYERIGGVRVPIALEMASNVLIAGTSTFAMRWDYQSVNAVHVGDPTPRRSTPTQDAPRR